VARREACHTDASVLENGVFTSDGTTVGTITTNSGLAFGNAAINNSGIVAFEAGPVNGPPFDALLVGAVGVAPQTVIQTGDALAGSTLVSFVISPRAINGAGQIAFWASLADGRRASGRAMLEYRPSRLRRRASASSPAARSVSPFKL
jgi:hypothetical protein